MIKKRLHLLAIIPVILFALILLNGFMERSKDYQLVYPVTDKVDYLSNPKLIVNPIKSKLTKEQVAQTARSKPCLVIYNNKVYEIPLEFFDLHLGGVDELVQGCGTDITFAFDMMPHSSNAQNLLESFYYAELQN